MDDSFALRWDDLGQVASVRKDTGNIVDCISECGNDILIMCTFWPASVT